MCHFGFLTFFFNEINLPILNAEKILNFLLQNKDKLNENELNAFLKEELDISNLTGAEICIIIYFYLKLNKNNKKRQFFDDKLWRK